MTLSEANALAHLVNVRRRAFRAIWLDADKQAEAIRIARSMDALKIRRWGNDPEARAF